MAKAKKKAVPELVNKPAPGTAHILGNWGLVTIDENMNEEQVAYAIKAGLPYWSAAPEGPVIDGPVESQSED